MENTGKACVSEFGGKGQLGQRSGPSLGSLPPDTQLLTVTSPGYVSQTPAWAGSFASNSICQVCQQEDQYPAMAVTCKVTWSPPTHGLHL